MARECRTWCSYSSDYDLVLKFQKEVMDLYKSKGENPDCCKMYNVGCMMEYMDYYPRTFEEILSSN